MEAGISQNPQSCMVYSSRDVQTARCHIVSRLQHFKQLQRLDLQYFKAILGGCRVRNLQSSRIVWHVVKDIDGFMYCCNAEKGIYHKHNLIYLLPRRTTQTASFSARMPSLRPTTSSLPCSCLPHQSIQDFMSFTCSHAYPNHPRSP